MNSTLSVIAFAMLAAIAQQAAPEDYVDAGQEISFEGKSYHLAWSIHPTKRYFKQEYLPKGQTLKDFQEMVTVDVLVGNTSAKQASDAKMEELKRRKAMDPVTKFVLLDNKRDGEIVLDFSISDGKKILEWNLYRYVQVKTESKNSLVLIAYSRRGELKNAKEFYENQKSSRNAKLKALTKVKIPKMKP